MKKINRLFPTVMLEAIIDDQETVNQRLLKELDVLFAGNKKRVLSYKWKDFIITDDKHQLGYTSFNSGSLCEMPEFEFFYNQIGEVINDFFAQLDFYHNWQFVNSWASVYPKGAYIPCHDHRPMEWSGAYYVKAHKDCGKILFTDPREYALQNEPENTLYRGNHMHSIDPVPGMLLLFPSYLKHETMPNETDEDRIIISFNIVTHINDNLPTS